MSVDAYDTAKHGTFCTPKPIKLWKLAMDLKYCLAAEPLVYVSIDIFGLLLELNRDNTKI